jgi:hypothetical protein
MPLLYNLLVCNKIRENGDEFNVELIFMDLIIYWHALNLNYISPQLCEASDHNKHLNWVWVDFITHFVKFYDTSSWYDAFSKMYETTFLWKTIKSNFGHLRLREIKSLRHLWLRGIFRQGFIHPHDSFVILIIDF